MPDNRFEVETDGINTFRESVLHAQLKSWYARPGDRLEVEVGRYVVDIVRDSMLIEIQTQNFSALKSKLENLLADFAVHVVYPISTTNWIVKLDQSEQPYERRKSPKKGHISHVASELVYIPQIVSHPKFSLEVLMIESEEIRQHIEKRRWRRRGWSTVERTLLGVQDSVVFPGMKSYLKLLPDELPVEFATSDLAAALDQPRRIGQQIAYFLYKAGLIRRTGKLGRAFVYSKVDTTAD